ncbi:hypothetical protein ACO0SA_000770 [Hanseniaspora valbyensis]
MTVNSNNKNVAYGNSLSINQSIILKNFNNIFSYKTFGNTEESKNVLDFFIKENIDENGSVFFQELPIRSGLGSLPLGYLDNESSNTKNSTIIIPSYGLKYLFPTLRKASPRNNSLKLLINIGNIDYQNDAIVPDYLNSLNIANELNYPVIFPINLKEIKETTLFASFLSNFGTTCHLIDAPAAKNTIFKVTENNDSTDIIDADAIVAKSGLNVTEAGLNDYINAFNNFFGFKIDNFDLKTSSAVQNKDDIETVFVSLGFVETTSFDEFLASNKSLKIGRLAVRIPSPFDGDKFIKSLPKNCKKIVVVEQTSFSHVNKSSKKNYLYSTIQSVLANAGISVELSALTYTSDFIWSKKAIKEIVYNSLNLQLDGQDNDLILNSQFNFWTDDNNSEDFFKLPTQILDNLIQHDPQFEPSLRAKFDNLTQGGTYQAQISVNRPNSNVIVNNDEALLTFVANSNILHKFDVLNTTKDNGHLVLFVSKPIEETVEYFTNVLKIPTNLLIKLASKQIKLILVDKSAIQSKDETKGRTLKFLIEALFWQYAYNLPNQDIIKKIWATNGTDIELLASVIGDSIRDNFEAAVKEIDSSKLYPEFLKLELEEKDSDLALQTYLIENSFEPNPRTDSSTADQEYKLETVTDVAKKLAFVEAYGTTTELRPDLPVKNFVVKVAKNKRVTPSDYDRNIFEIEFDIGNSGLKYEIGEALGVHAKNDTEKVIEFLHSYGVTDLNQIVSVANKDDPSKIESRTVLQTFVENVDIFGKPGKKFYESLIKFTKDEAELKKLINLISPAGASELKKYQDEDFFTYADILSQLPLCKPTIPELISIVPALKRREYSIASSQRVHPNKIHLLIVVVSWRDSRNRLRFGQASKYLSDLPVGAELVVSVKPSVMKLPPRPEQPVIMSGLGTGLAPFKAIVEEKIWQKQQGHKIGSIYLFLGSRHKVEEYLYGELWEAWRDAGVITHIGAAFSRDQPEKIYIQDRIQEVLPELKVAMCDEEGSFYLCGPTWPVPNITAALQSILKKDATERGVKIDLDQAIEELKDTARYILEVY